MNLKKNPIYVVIGALLPILAFVLSLSGFRTLRELGGSTDKKAPQVSSSIDWGMGAAPEHEEYYQSVKLFLRGTDFRTLEKLPDALAWGRFFALLTVIYNSVLLGTILLQRSLRELRLRRDWLLSAEPGLVIFGLSEQFGEIVPELGKRHENKWSWREPVVVVLEDTESSLAKSCRAEGVWVVEAPSYETALLEYSGVRNAKEVFIFGDIASKNLELALDCQRAIGEKPRRKGIGLLPPEIHVQIEDSHLLYAYQTRQIGRDHLNAATVVPFTIPGAAARVTFSGGRLSTYPDGTGAPRVGQTTHVLCGSGAWLQAFLEEAIKGSVVDVDEVARIVVFTPNAERQRRRFEIAIPEWEDLHCEVEFLSVDETSPEAMAGVVFDWLGLGIPSGPLNILCLLLAEGECLAFASLLQAHIGSLHTELAERTRILFLSEGAGTVCRDFVSDSAPVLEPIGGKREFSSLEILSRAPLWQVAVAINVGYLEAGAENDFEKARELQEFYDLPGVRRDQNFSQADHLEVKLAHLGLPCSMEVAGAEVSKCIDELNRTEGGRAKIKWLAELEHIRWMEVHRIAGFRYAETGGAAIELRLHDCLLPVEDENLRKETLVHDYQSIVDLPKLVDAVGRRIMTLNRRD